MLGEHAVSALGIALVALVMAVGLVGVVLPFLPGSGLIWTAGLVFGIVDGFTGVGWVLFGLMTVFALAGTAASVALPHRAGVRAGASRQALGLGVLLGIIGFFLIPVVGLVVGAVAGVLLAEYQRFGDWAAAWRTSKRVIVGFGLGAAAEFVASFAMILCWVAWVVAG